MYRLAFLMAVVFALFCGQTGDPSGGAAGPPQRPEAALASQGDADLPQPGVAVGSVVIELDPEPDDDAAVRQQDRTACGETARADDPIVGFGVGPSQSHARPMERPPRV